MPLIKMKLSIGFANASQKDEEYVDDEFWESLTEKGREDFLESLARDWAYNYIEFNAWVEES